MSQGYNEWGHLSQTQLQHTDTHTKAFFFVFAAAVFSSSTFGHLCK